MKRLKGVYLGILGLVVGSKGARETTLRIRRCWVACKQTIPGRGGTRSCPIFHGAFHPANVLEEPARVQADRRHTAIAYNPSIKMHKDMV